MFFVGFVGTCSHHDKCDEHRSHHQTGRHFRKQRQVDRKQIACEQTYDNEADNTCGQQRISAGFKIFRLVGCTLIDAVAGFIVQQLLSLRQRLLLGFLYFLCLKSRIIRERSGNIPDLFCRFLRCCLFQRLYKRRAAVGADGVAVLIFCFTVWTPRHRTRPPYLPDRYSSIPFAPAFPAPIARITVAAPVTASPPAKTAALLV